MTSMRSLMLASAAAAALAAIAPVAAPAAGRCGEPAQRPRCTTSLGPDARADLLMASPRASCAASRSWRCVRASAGA